MAIEDIATQFGKKMRDIFPWVHYTEDVYPTKRWNNSNNPEGQGI